MNILCRSLFDSIGRPIGLGLGLAAQNICRSNVKLIGTRPNARAKTSVSGCNTKLWMHINSNTLVYSYVSSRPSHRLACSYSSDDLDCDETFVSNDYQAFKIRKDNGRQGSILRLQDILKCSQKNITCILKEFPELLLITREMMSERLLNLSEFGLKRDVLKDNPWLLLYKTKEISRKFQLVRNMELDINVGTPLLRLPLYRLKVLSNSAAKEAPLIPEKSRIMHISNVLQCHPTDVCKAVAGHIFLQTVPFERITAILDLLVEYDVPPEAVLKDVWVFRYNPLTVEKRFKEMRDAGVILKPWVVRCSAEVFSNALRRRVESRNALGENSSLLDYLSQRLECSLESIAILSQRYPPILKVHVTKIKEVLDFLYSEGFSPRQIYQVPRILCHSLETTQRRLHQLRDLQHNPTSLMVVCKSKRQFDDYLSRLSCQQKQAFTG